MKKLSLRRLTYLPLIAVLMSSFGHEPPEITEQDLILDDDFFLDTALFDADFMEEGNTNEEELICYFVEEMPVFGTGTEDLLNYLKESIIYPQTAIDDGIEGRNFIQFVINEDGSVSNPKILRGSRYDLDQECIRVIENMPDWKPGKQRGKFVKVSFVVPVVFRLKSDSEKKNVKIPYEAHPQTVGFKLFPNPASEFVNIELPDVSDDLEYQLFNSNGQKLRNGQINASTEQIIISDLENGVYFIRIVSEGKGLVKTQKLVKK